MQFNRLFALDTKFSRAFLVALMLCLTLGVTHSISSENIIPPTEMYFYTVEEGGVDIRSPTKKVIIESAFKSYDSKSYTIRCNFALPSDPNIPIGAIHRDVMLCNTAMRTGDEFTLRSRYFLSNVDDIYVEYYEKWAKRIILGILEGIGAWIILLLVALTGRWIAAGR